MSSLSSAGMLNAAQSLSADSLMDTGIIKYTFLTSFINISFYRLSYFKTF